MHSISLMNLKIVNRNPYLDWTNRIKFKESRRKKTEPLKVTYVFYGRKKKRCHLGIQDVSKSWSVLKPLLVKSLTGESIKK